MRLEERKVGNCRDLQHERREVRTNLQLPDLRGPCPKNVLEYGAEGCAGYGAINRYRILYSSKFRQIGHVYLGHELCHLHIYAGGQLRYSVHRGIKCKCNDRKNLDESYSTKGDMTPRPKHRKCTKCIFSHSCPASPPAPLDLKRGG